MCDILGRVLVEAFFAVMAVSSRCIVSTVDTDPTTMASRQFIQLHVEQACTGVQITVTS